jgi:hypothetical protein
MMKKYYVGETPMEGLTPAERIVSDLIYKRPGSKIILHFIPREY